jgi:uncharacterized protein (DUF1684 family)
MDTSVPAILALAGWRRSVAELYARVRADPDPGHAWATWRDARRDLFAHHPQSPIPEPERASYAGPHLYEHDPAARTMAEVVARPATTVEIGTSDGGLTRCIRFGEATFELFGQVGSLDLFWLDAYGGGLYLSFRDATSADTTYGGGRYLLDSVKGADLGTEGGRLVLDFNFAYQPSCSYDPQWSCPLPPPSNRLPFPVPAGERLH